MQQSLPSSEYRSSPLAIATIWILRYIAHSMDAQVWIRKFHFLTIILILSATINVGLVTAFIVTATRKPSFSYSLASPNKISLEMTNQALLLSYTRLSFRELSTLLTNTDTVEDGYRKRDLALSALVSVHHFNLEKALGGQPLQRRSVYTAPNEQTVEAFPGLTEDQFKAIIRFAYLEKWPLTGQGLFKVLQKAEKPRDLYLEQAFMITPEFAVLQALFQKSDPPIEPSSLIDLVTDGSWAMLSGFVREQTQMLDLSDDKRRRFLLSYLAIESSVAARLLLTTDFSFVLKRLDDQGIFDLLERSPEMNPLLKRFCTELLKSPRSDAVWLKAAYVLYHSIDEPIPEPFNRLHVLSHFAPETRLNELPSPLLRERPKPRCTHIVQDGENLWKIARLYRIKLDELVSFNELEKDQILPGMILQIP